MRIQTKLIISNALCAAVAGALLLSVASGCGEDDVEPTSTTEDAGPEVDDAAMDAEPEEAEVVVAPPPDLAEVYCRPLAEEFCGRAATCNCPAPVGDETACVQHEVTQCLLGFQAVQTRITSGELVVNTDNIATCIAAVTAASLACEGPHAAATQANCQNVIASPEAVGSPCTYDWCDSGAGHCVGGVCAALPVAGESCTGMCGDGSFCESNTCTTKLAADGVCTNDEQCAPPLRCLAGACGDLLQIGQVCEGHIQCEVGLACRDNEGVGLCSNPPEDCVNSTECGNGNECVTLAQQVCAPLAALADDCTKTTDCGPTTWCSSGSCQVRPALGETCGDGKHCAPGLGCSQAAPFECVAIPGDGEPCAKGSDDKWKCTAGLACLLGTCGPAPGVTEDCALDKVCADGLGCDVKATSATCLAKGDVGAGCSSDDLCNEGLFCDFDAKSCKAERGIGDPCEVGNECDDQAECQPDGFGGANCAAIPGQGDDCFALCTDGLYCQFSLAATSCQAAVCQAVGEQP